MVHSMTAYARKETLTQIGRISCEIRSVNHRYLDISFRLPEEMRMLEPRLRESVSQQVKRGKLDVSLRVQAESGYSRPININPEVLQQLQQVSQQLNKRLHDVGSPSWLDVLRWPGLLEDERIEEDTLAGIVNPVVENCLQDLLANRRREGEQLKGLISSRLDSMKTIVETVLVKMPEFIQLQKDKLRTRLEEIQGELDQSRLEQEMVYMAQRWDVDEELQRLKVHIQEIRQTLERDEPIGRRLDFLSQELNREANTLGSKSVHADSSNASVELKVLIEQIREQVQNIE